MSSYLLQYTICEWYREGVLDCYCIETSEVDIDPDLGGILLKGYDYGEYPFTCLNLKNNTGL